MTLEELATIDGLGEKKIEDYGSKLVKTIENFVATEDLEEYVQGKKDSQRPAKKQRIYPKSAAAVIEIDNDDEFDEFPMDIDLSNVELPADNAANKVTAAKSKYF
jgi:hypothetical protein